MVGYRQVNRHRTNGISLPSPHWQKRFSELCDGLQITKSVKLFQSERVEIPMVIGFLKPIILIPTSVFLQMDAKQLETIIAHELTHIKRFDYLINTVQNLAEIIFFYHPGVWWVSSIIRHERECACDQSVVRLIKNSDFTYARALITILEIGNKSVQSPAQISISATGGRLANRIIRIINNEKPILRSFQRSLLSSLLVFVFIFTCVCLVSLTTSKSGDVLTYQPPIPPTLQNIPSPPKLPPAPPAPPKPPSAPPAPPMPPIPPE